ncbi:hypothetical protein ACIHFD_18055 [Nonomuraea sp. NPDC051941]
MDMIKATWPVVLRVFSIRGVIISSQRENAVNPSLTLAGGYEGSRERLGF